MTFRQFKFKVLERLRAFFLVRKVRDIYNFLLMGDLVKLPDNFKNKRALIIAPHPDDEAIGCGGTIAIITGTGGTVDVVYMTKGELAGGVSATYSPALRDLMRQARVREAKASCDVLGVRNMKFFEGVDSSLHNHATIWEDILGELETEQYDYVFCPWPFDAHSDHVSAFSHLTRALSHYKPEIQVWLYEVWNPLVANRIIPIDKTMDKKLAAIDKHESQLALRDYREVFIGLSRYRSLYVDVGRYAEAFLTLSKKDVLKLSHRTRILLTEFRPRRNRSASRFKIAASMPQDQQPVELHRKRAK